jgi:hypothetical protein
MKKRKYLYAISYSCTMADGRQGDGCSQLYFSRKINTQERFLAAVDFIKSENNLTNCVILNIILLGRKWI